MKLHHTDAAPAAIGPYSQALTVGGWLYTSGQVAIVPATGELAGTDFDAQARQVFANLRAVLAAAGLAANPCTKPCTAAFSRTASVDES